MAFADVPLSEPYPDDEATHKPAENEDKKDKKRPDPFPDHPRTSVVLDNTPYILRDNEWRLGLWKFSYVFPKPVDRLEIGTFFPYWWLFATGNKTANGYLKVVPWNNDEWIVGVTASYFYLNLEGTDEMADMDIVPLQIDAAYSPRSDLMFNGGVWLTWTGGDVQQFNDESLDNLQGAVATSSLQFVAGATWLLGDHSAINAHARVILTQDADGTAVDERSLGSQTTAITYLSGTAESVSGGNLGVSGQWYWTSFNLRVGVVYGYYVLPGAQFVVPNRQFWPEFDIFWRF